MIDEKRLIEQIIDEVYRILQTKEEDTRATDKMVVIDDESLMLLQDLEHHYKVELYNERTTSCDILVLSQVSIELLSHLALGAIYSPKEAFIIETLLKGKMVYILEEGIAYRKYKHRAHRALYTLYSDYEDKIQKYGIKIIRNVLEIIGEQPVVSRLKPKQSDLKENSHTGISLQNKKLISEVDLRNVYMQGILEVVVDKKSIVTSLAEDFAKSHHLKVKRV